MAARAQKVALPPGFLHLGVDRRGGAREQILERLGRRLDVVVDDGLLRVPAEARAADLQAGAAGFGIAEQHGLGDQHVLGAVAPRDGAQRVRVPAERPLGIDGRQVAQVAERHDQGDQPVARAPFGPGRPPEIGFAPQTGLALGAENRQDDDRLAHGLGVAQAVGAQELAYRLRLEAEGQAGQVAHVRGALVLDLEILYVGEDLARLELAQQRLFVARQKPGQELLHRLDMAFGVRLFARGGGGLGGDVDRDPVHRKDVRVRAGVRRDDGQTRPGQERSEDQRA